jgi:pyruvate/2-oxoacid:ferredoxin oxidoreductase alpha subunit
VTLADPRPDADGVLCHGYMELRALHQQALERALQVIPSVDDAYAGALGRRWGGLTWSHLLDDAEIVLVAAGSLGMELTVAAEALRRDGIAAGVLGIRAYRPFPADAIRAALLGRQLVIVFDKALSYGHEGPICSDVRAVLSVPALGSSTHTATAPIVFGAVAGLGGRDVSVAHLTAVVRKAQADFRAGVQARATEWINSRLQATA